MKIFKGRINIRNYFGGVTLIVLVFGLLNLAITFLQNKMIGHYTFREISAGLYLTPQFWLVQILSIVLSLLVFLLISSLWVRRIHNFNKPAYLYIILIIFLTAMLFLNLNNLSMIIGLIFSLILLFYPGNKEENKYGQIDTNKDLFKLFI